MKQFGWILLTLLALFIPSPGHAAPESPEPFFTNKPRFRIPFRFDPKQVQQLGANEMRLFLSVDSGQTWQHVQSVAPAKKSFEFTARADGEYWFAVRVVDQSNQLHPGGPISQPALRVVVDTRLPTLQLRVTSNGPGRVQLQWSATDPAIDVKSLMLEYIEPGGTDWRQVAIIPKVNGQTTWTVPRPGMVSVRGKVLDRAGNEARAESNTEVSVPNGLPQPVVPDFNQPIAGHGTLAPQPNTAMKMPGGSQENAVRYPSGSNSTSFGTVGDSPIKRPEVFRGRYPNPVPSRPSSTSTRIINKREFQLDYELAEVGPSGVSAVELFITQDNGRNWFLYGNDEDNRSPFNVELPGPGTFGFDIRAASGVGLSNAPPQPGEKPSILIVVDETPPVISMEKPAHADRRVLLRWQVRETNPVRDSVLLSYSESPNGPWHSISDWSVDHGQYEWLITPEIPPRVFLRVSSRDAAGNVAHAQLRDAFVVDLSQPKARIVDIDPRSLDR